MPRGTVELPNGKKVYYDHAVTVGDVTVIKTSYDHNVYSFGTGTAKFYPGEWHRTPLGSCKKLSEYEIQRELDEYK